MARQRNTLESLKATMVITEGDCWLWAGATNQAGIPLAKIHNVFQPLHRAFYAQAHPEVDLTHANLKCTCGNKNCCNPAHYIIAKGAPENRYGITKAQRKLTEEEVKLIKRGIALGLPLHSLSRTFKVSATTIKDIAKGRTWAWVVLE